MLKKFLPKHNPEAVLEKFLPLAKNYYISHNYDQYKMKLVELKTYLLWLHIHVPCTNHLNTSHS